jgi:ABC-type transporter Mla subunit MlaD
VKRIGEEKKMNVRSKLLFNAIITIVCVLGVGITGYFFTNKVANVSLSLFETQARPVLKINEAEKAAQVVFSRLIVHSNTSDLDTMEKIEQEIDELNGRLAKKIEEYKEIAGNQVENISKGEKSAEVSSASLNGFREKWNQFNQIAKEILELSRNFNKEEALSKIVGEGKAAYDEAMSIMGDKINNHQQQMIVLRDEARSARGKSVILIVSFVFLALGIVIAGASLITRSITKPLNRAIEGLTESSVQVASASNQVSSSSQKLAEGASEQAASIEETSSSLEEMSSMTRQNAGNAIQADNLMKETNQVVSKANGSMKELTVSIDEISKASEETSKIIKTIDEIAFQTNLLALNAAVEAARAGEAGAGFAVVADEVRNLAMRAAEAAGNTADLIEGTVKKVKDGGDLVATTNDAFTEVATSAAKVGELVGEIAAASNEQAQGIGQVNTAVAEMDKVVQQNAANAEESASASEEMSAQAEQMKGFVGELVALVGGSNNGVKQGRPPRVTALKALTRRAVAGPGKADRTKGMNVAIHKAKEVNPEQVIPMDDEDFKNF